MNVKLLRKIKKYILAEPKRLYMNWYVVRRENEHELINGRQFAKCGTAACIAGWALLLSGKDPNANFDIHAEASGLLGLSTYNGYEAASRLFEAAQWPEKFNKGLTDDGKAATAKIAAARIEHFIKTKGRE